LNRTDNRGFSLLELIIAVLIFGLIVSPLLHTFLSSANSARGARAMDSATNAAANLVEQIKSAKTITNFTATAAPDRNGIYTIPISDFAHGTRTYDGEVILDPTPYSGSSDPAKNINAQKPIKSPTDGVNYGFENNSEIDYQAILTLAVPLAQEMSDTAAIPDLSPFLQPATEQVLSALSRQITFDINESGDNLQITARFEYTFGADTITEDMPPLTAPKSASIFLFYYPLYGAQSDKITVRNNQNGTANINISQITQ